MNRTKRPQKAKSKKALEQSMESKLEVQNQRLQAFQNGLLALDQRLRLLDKKSDVIYNNQVALAESETRLDEQFCVSTRLAIVMINKLTKLKETTVEPIAYAHVNKMFQEFEAFRSRPDFREHMEAWFMGEDLSQLPPPPELEKQEEEPEAVQAEGSNEPPAQTFGGDYAEKNDSGDAGSTEERSEDAATG